MWILLPVQTWDFDLVNLASKFLSSLKPCLAAMVFCSGKKFRGVSLSNSPILNWKEYRAVFFSIASTMLLVSSLILPGCNSTTCLSKPLKGIEKYQVTLFVSPYGDLNAEKIKKLVKEKLASLGQVVEAKIPISEEIPMLFISIEPKGSVVPSTIQVLGRVKVLKNGYELTSVIWSHSLKDEEASLPIERSGKVAFVQKENSPISKDPLDSLFCAFIDEYRAANSKKVPITFLIFE